MPKTYQQRVAEVRSIHAEIVSARDDIIQKVAEIQNAIKQIEYGGANCRELLVTIDNANKQINDKQSEIAKLHNEIFGVAEGSEQSQADRLSETIDEFEERRQELLGDDEVNAEGEQTTPGQIAKLIKEIMKTIERAKIIQSDAQDLLEQSTTASLSNSFQQASQKFRDKHAMWEWISAVTFLFAIIVAGLLFWHAPKELDYATQLPYFLRTIPVISIIGWTIYFVISRRAEYMKLEEIYKHKETLAKAYLGYKDQIEELNDGEQLLAKLMETLLDAIKKDASKYLSVKDESILSSLLGQTKSVNSKSSKD